MPTIYALFVKGQWLLLGNQFMWVRTRRFGKSKSKTSKIDWYAFLDAPLLSLYFQAITFLSIGYLLHSQPLENIDFEVYRDEPNTRTA